MKCTYTYNNTTYDSYVELITALNTLLQIAGENGEQILKFNGEDIVLDDILYSAVLGQTQQLQTLEKMKEQAIFAKGEGINGEPALKDKTTIFNYLDSNACQLNGQRLVAPLNMDDYIKNFTRQLMNDSTKKRTEAEAEQEARDNVAMWKILQDDGYLLHQYYTDVRIYNKNDKDGQDFVNHCLDNKELAARITNQSILKNLYMALHKQYIIEKGYYPGSFNASNRMVSAKVKGLAEEVFGHIDMLFVGADGTLHLYLYKTTQEYYKNWVNPKWHRYKYELAFLKYMLQANGLDVRDMEFKIIPVQLQYTDEEKPEDRKIRGINVSAPINISTRSTSSEYSLADYDRRAEALVETSGAVEFVPEEAVRKASDVNRAIFPELNVKMEGYLGDTAQMWISQAPNVDVTGTEPLVIREVGDGHEVTINGHTYRIEGKNQRKQIRDLVQSHIEELKGFEGYAAQKIKDALANSYRKGFAQFDNVKKYAGTSRRLQLVFNPYLQHTENEDGTKVYDWEFLEDLVPANVFVFKNKDTHEIDVVALSMFDLNSKAPFQKGNHILGSYLGNVEQGRSELQNDWGNIEAVRTMELINQMVPSLKNYKLRTLYVTSIVGNNYFRAYNMGQFNREHFQNILKVVGEMNPSMTIENNFPHAEFVSPIDELCEEYTRILDTRNDFGKEKLEYYGFDQLAQAQTRHEQILRLQNIINEIYQLNREFQNPAELQKALEGRNVEKREMASLLDLATKALGYATGQSVRTQTDLQPIEAYGFTSMTVPDQNIQTVVRNLQITHDAISSEFLKEFDRTMFDEYYRSIGYTDFQNITFGNQATQYRNMFDTDLTTGRMTMNFKNPYDMSNDLTEPERKLLKQVLYKITWINTNGNFMFSRWDDPKIAQYVDSHPEYLWVPLIRASKVTSRQSVDAMKAKFRNTYRRMRNAAERFDEFVNGITSEERELLGNDNDNFYEMKFRNPFELSMPSSNNIDVIRSRQNMIQKYGPEFFETNVENILIEFLVKHISTTQFNKLVLGTKALMLQLYLTGDYGGNMDTVNKEIDWLQKYLKVNVFNTSIMSKQEKNIVGVLSPLRHIVTHMLVGGNITSAIRDFSEGLQQNIVRSLIKYNTDLSSKNVAKAYAYVTTHATSNPMAANLLSKLCLKYRLSNTDVGRIAERAKTARTGFFSWETWLYSTMRGPDFINRMTLFVARCMQDGVWDAFSLDEDGNLVYDWTKDERYSIYASKNTTHPEYKSQMGKYLSAIRQYNKDNPDNPVRPEDGLPEPYQRETVLYIRNLADNIFGSYDRGKRSLYERTSWGFAFGMFTTWFNGIVNNYFMRPQKNGAYGFTVEQETDDQGRPLFFDENYNITTRDTGVKVWHNVPIFVQGIFPTIGTLYGILSNTPENRFAALRAYLRANPHEKANIRKLLSDIILGLLFFLIFNHVVKPAYRKYKQDKMEYNPLIVNMFVEALTKGTSRSGDQYKGPLNVLQFVGDNMNSPIYSQSVQVLKEAGQAAVGSKSVKYLLFDNLGFTRSFKDSALNWWKLTVE